MFIASDIFPSRHFFVILFPLSQIPVHLTLCIPAFHFFLDGCRYADFPDGLKQCAQRFYRHQRNGDPYQGAEHGNDLQQRNRTQQQAEREIDNPHDDAERLPEWVFLDVRIVPAQFIFAYHRVRKRSQEHFRQLDKTQTDGRSNYTDYKQSTYQKGEQGIQKSEIRNVPN